jgi:acetyltransferase-like isoleucine patch superfamily enzyme
MIREVLQKRKFDLISDRLGPDCPFTHWKLYFKTTMNKICKTKFKKFDKNSEFRAGAYAITCSKISIGKNVVIRPNTMLFADPRQDSKGYINIGDNVMLGSGVHIYVSNHRYDLLDKDIINQGHYSAKNVILEQGCWIGANSIILPGITIGKNAVIGAGSIVTKNIPAKSVWAGNPAVLIKDID